MAFVRCFLLVCVLLRLAVGTAWAMPTPVAVGDLPSTQAAVTLPCHMPTAAEPVGDDHAGGSQAHAGVHPASGHCSLCFSAATVPFAVHATALPHSMPATPAMADTPWQPLPELRPPI